MNLSANENIEIRTQQEFKKIFKKIWLLLPEALFFDVVDLLHKRDLDASPEVSRVFLYRRPLLDYWRETSEPLERLLCHVVI